MARFGGLWNASYVVRTADRRIVRPAQGEAGGGEAAIVDMCRSALNIRRQSRVLGITFLWLQSEVGFATISADMQMSYTLKVPAGPISEALRNAADGARALEYETAIGWQRRALDLCKAEGLCSDAVVVIELTLASYQLHLAMTAPERAEEAAATLESVIRGARRRGMHAQQIHAKTGLVTARSLQGRHEEAAEVCLGAASLATQMDQPLVAGDFLLSAGDATFAAGDRPRAVSLWRAGLAHLTETADDLAVLDERSVVRALIELAEGNGTDSVVRRYRRVLDLLSTFSGSN